MKKIELIAVGELKFKGLQQLEKQYLDKLKYFAQFQVKALKDVKINNEAGRKRKEGEMMLQHLSPGDFVIALDEKGKKLDSTSFARLLEEKVSYHPGRIVFLIGGHAGLAPEVTAKVNLTLSFSPMTFPHDLFRVLFLEQLYRAFTIIKGIKYHR